ncbi:MAG TPA: NUDIX domain-containing protein [Ktedonobacteraceae bacterium]|nr:NUDIX domain-containing protein [Ktedonobacteraceae bacterium]
MRLLKSLKKAYHRLQKRVRHSVKIGAFGIILDEHEHVLLCHRCDVDLWNLPGGGVEEGETPVQAVIREVKEEVGLKVAARKLVGIYIHPGKVHLAFSYICEITGGKIKKSDEADSIAYFAFRKIPANTYPFHVERIADALEKPAWFRLRLEFGPSAKKLFKQGKLGG